MIPAPACDLPARPKPIKPQVADVDQLADIAPELVPVRETLGKVGAGFWLLPKSDGALILGFVDALMARLDAAEGCLAVRQ